MGDPVIAALVAAIAALAGGFITWLLGCLTESRRMRHEITMAEIEARQELHHVRYSTLYVKRAEVIAEVYAALEDLHVRFAAFLANDAGQPSQEEASRAVFKQFFQFQALARSRKLFLTPRVWQSIGAFLEICHSGLNAKYEDMPAHGGKQWLNEVITPSVAAMGKALHIIELEFRSYLEPEDDESCGKD